MFATLCDADFYSLKREEEHETIYHCIYFKQPNYCLFLCADPEHIIQNVPVVNVVSIQEATILFYESKQFRGFENTDQLLKAVSQMLYQSGYDHDPSKIKILETSKNYVTIINTCWGKKFVKIKKRRGPGFDEFLGTLIFKNFAPILPIEELILSSGLELLVYPFNASAEPDLLFYKFRLWRCKIPGKHWIYLIRFSLILSS